MSKTNAKAASRTTAASARARSSQPATYRVRRSPVHGTGLFAAREISKGEEIIEYAGERITHEEADRRHADKADDDNHTFLFTIDRKTVVDGGVQGNDARFINHSCAPNCEVLIDEGRLLVEALRAVSPGEELTYDYNLTRASEDQAEIERIFACRCGAATCRGTMLQPLKKPKAAVKAPAKRAKGGSKAASKTASRSGSKTSSKTSPKTGSKTSSKPGSKPGSKTSSKPSSKKAGRRKSAAA